MLEAEIQRHLDQGLNQPGELKHLINCHQKIQKKLRQKKKIVLDLRRTKSTENLQAPDRSEATEDLGGSGMDLSDKQQIEPEEPSTTHDEVKIEQPPVSQSKTETEQAPKKSDASRTTSPPPTKKVSMKKEPAEPIPPPKLPSGGGAKGGKKSKKKFARHKVRSDSPENDLVDLVDPDETQVATADSDVKPRKIAKVANVDKIEEEKEGEEGQGEKTEGEEKEVADINVETDDDDMSE